MAMNPSFLNVDSEGLADWAIANPYLRLCVYTMYTYATVLMLFDQ